MISIYSKSISLLAPVSYENPLTWREESCVSEDSTHLKGGSRVEGVLVFSGINTLIRTASLDGGPPIDPQTSESRKCQDRRGSVSSHSNLPECFSLDGELSIDAGDSPRSIPKSLSPIPGLGSIDQETWDQVQITTKVDLLGLYLLQLDGIPWTYLSEERAICPIEEGERYTSDLHRELRSHFGRAIGTIRPIEGEKLPWKNTASTIEELHKDSQEAAPILKEIATLTAEAGDGQADFGEKDMFITKSVESLQRKVRKTEFRFLPPTEKAHDIDEDPRTRAVAKIGDSVRGTVFFDSQQKMKQAISSFKLLLKERQIEVVFDNKWETFRADGYAAIHAKFLIPISKRNKVIGELQFHLKDLYDGTAGSPKERAHKMYEKSRILDSPAPRVVSASKFMYTVAIAHAAGIGITGEIRSALSAGRVKELVG